MNFEDVEQPGNNHDEQSCTAAPGISARAAALHTTRVTAGAAWQLGEVGGQSGSIEAGIPRTPCHIYVPAVPIRHLEGVLLEQLEIYHHKIQRAIDRIPDEAILTQQLVGEVWRGRVFVMGFFRAVEHILSASRSEWSFFDPRARLHYRVHDARWEADQAAHDAIELIAARRHVKEE